MSVITMSDFETVKDLQDTLAQIAKQGETAFLVVNDELLMLSPAEIAKEKIAERIVNRLAENPTILHDLETRLRAEKPEPWI